MEQKNPKKKKACIILPTYNEAENIKPLLKAIKKETSKIKNWDIHVLVVDDNSPDRTAKIVLEEKKKNKKIHLITGNKQGLGVAYKRGMKEAITKIKPEVIFEMDADFSHPPKLIKEFLKEIEKGADFVIGSRYIPGGGTPDWTIIRKIISKGGNFFARIIAGLYKTKDCTSGYRAIRTSLIKKINLEEMAVKGYAFQLTLLSEATRKKAKIKEIPLIFPDRKKGKSKIGIKDMKEFFTIALKLGINKNAELIKFLIVGGTGIIVNLGVMALLTEISRIHYLISSIIAIELSIIWNFILNNNWTFKGKARHKTIIRRAADYHAVSLGGMIINWLTLLILATYLGVNYLIGQFIGIIIATTWNYLLSKNYAWKTLK